MPARQEHGLQFEEFINTMVESFSKSEGHTDKDDGFMDTLNHGRIAVSAKNTSLKGEICLGDMERIVYSEDPLLVFNGRHLTGVSMPETVFVHYLPYGFSAHLGDGWEREEGRASVMEFKDYMTNPCNELREEDEESVRSRYGNDSIDYHSDEFNSRWRKRMQEFKDDYFDIFDGQGNIIIHPRPKRSHSQSRLQCAIPYRFITGFAQEHLVMSLAYNENGTTSVRDYMTPVCGYDEDYLDEMIESGEIDDYRYGSDAFGAYVEYDFLSYDQIYAMDTEERAWCFLESTLYNLL